MSKLTDVVLRRGTDPDLDAFVQEQITFWNFGRYQARVTDGVPTYNGQEGEFHFVWDGSTLFEYVYAAGAWRTISGGAGSGSTPGTPVNSVQFNNPLGTFDGSAQLVYVEDNGLAIRQGNKLYFDNTSTTGTINAAANTHFMYDVTQGYLELTVDGELRAQF